ncbi:response regulator transcription factor [Rhodoblastus sp.]|uniref:response regulator transcription factor n=1 Tax=Rhodoblastus sp. TaxID=1962975 RepID=UPI003F9E62D0
MKPGILIVDNQPNAHRLLKQHLNDGGFDAISIDSGVQAIDLILTQKPDLVLLELALADIDGKEVIRTVRESSQAPIIVISSRNREAEKIEALDAGANDYVVKPFAIGELLARIRAHLRGAARRNTVNTEDHREVLLDLGKRTALVRGHVHKLTRKELALLQVLMRDADRIVPHHFILQKLWGASHDMSAQYLRVLVRRLRQKIEIDPASPKILLTEAGVGYRLVYSPD